VIAPVQQAIEAYIALCPYALPPDKPLSLAPEAGRLPKTHSTRGRALRGALGLPIARRHMPGAIPSRTHLLGQAATCARSGTLGMPRCPRRKSNRRR